MRLVGEPAKFDEILDNRLFNSLWDENEKEGIKNSRKKF